jgi:hypothetical protein
LRGLAQAYGIEPRAQAAGGEALSETLAAHLKRPQVLRAILDELGEDERAALKVITFAGGGSGIVMEQCHQRINQVTGRRRRNGAQIVAGLMGRGMVYVGRAKYRQFYFVPSDLQTQLATMFGQELLSRVAIAADIEVRAQSSDSYAVMRWICQFLAYTQKSVVELTQAGAIYRRTQRVLLRMMGRDLGPEEPAEAPREGQPPGTGLHPDPLDFVFDYCRSRELCEVVNGALQPTIAAEQWMSLPLRQRREDLLGFWREARISWDVDVQAVLSVLMTLPDSAWVDLQALFHEVEPMASDLFRGSLRRRLEHKVVRYLILQGLLDIGETAHGPVCRLTDLGRALLGARGAGVTGAAGAGGDETEVQVQDVEIERRFFIQPNFELLVPARLDTALLWRLEEIADLDKPDWMMVYRVSRASVYRALRLGRGAGEILGLLEQHALNELPQNVAFSVRDWATAFGRIRFAAAFTLQCDTAALADELMASRSVRQYVLGRLSPTVLIVDRQRHADLIAALESEGYMPSPIIVTLGDIDPWGEPWEVVDLTADGPPRHLGGAARAAEDTRDRSTRASDRRKSESL